MIKKIFVCDRCGIEMTEDEYKKAEEDMNLEEEKFKILYYETIFCAPCQDSFKKWMRNENRTR